MTVDPTLPYSDALRWQDIDRRVTALERAGRRPNIGVRVVSGNASQLPTASWAALVGTGLVFDAPPSGRVLVVAWVNHTPDGTNASLGIQPATSTPSSGLIYAAAAIVASDPGSSPYTESQAYVAPMDVDPGSHTLSLYLRGSATASWLGYTASFTLAVIPT